MEFIEYYTANYMPHIFISILSLILILFIITIIQQVKLGKLKKKYQAFMKSGEKDIEQLLLSQIDQIDGLKEKLIAIDQHQLKLDKGLEGAYQKLGVVRYNAFQEMGGNLSYAIALLNHHNNGFLINGIHSREGSYTYVKAIEKGASSTHLSDEEKEALNIAMKV